MWQYKKRKTSDKVAADMDEKSSVALTQVACALTSVTTHIVSAITTRVTPQGEEDPGLPTVFMHPTTTSEPESQVSEWLRMVTTSSTTMIDHIYTDNDSTVKTRITFVVTTTKSTQLRNQDSNLLDTVISPLQRLLTYPSPSTASIKHMMQLLNSSSSGYDIDLTSAQFLALVKQLSDLPNATISNYTEYVFCKKHGSAATDIWIHSSAKPLDVMLIKDDLKRDVSEGKEARRIFFGKDYPQVSESDWDDRKALFASQFPADMSTSK